jgi:hypothetical protein
VYLTQSDADTLRAMAKNFNSTSHIDLLQSDKLLKLEATSIDGTEKFFLDIERCVIKLTKWKYQERARRCIQLMRLDIDGRPHSNRNIPLEDQVEIMSRYGWPYVKKLDGTHIHIYIENHESRWAFPLSIFPSLDDIVKEYGSVAFRPLLVEFLKLCNFQTIPPVVTGLDEV